MRLAEALILRSDLQKRTTQLKTRISKNLLVQEGEDNSENPTELLEQYDALVNEWVALVKSINLTNNTTPFTDGGTLVDALAQRDGLKKKIEVLDLAVGESYPEYMRYSGSEIRIIKTLNIQELQKKADRFRKEWRELDTKIQELNWTTELLES